MKGLASVPGLGLLGEKFGPHTALYGPRSNSRPLGCSRGQEGQGVDTPEPRGQEGAWPRGSPTFPQALSAGAWRPTGASVWAGSHWLVWTAQGMR